MTTAQTDQRTLVTFLLDETGSMEPIKDDTIGGFNSYLGALKAEPGALIDFTLIKFDSRAITKVCVAAPVDQVADLTTATYTPGAATPLIDAAYKTIKAVEASLNGKQPKIVVCIQTDGHENASTEHTWDELNALIKEKTAAGWQFNFLGTGIDAYDTGARMGVAAMNTMSTGRSSQHVRASYAAMADSTRNFAAGRADTVGLAHSARAASGDAHYGRIFGQQPLAQAPLPPAPTQAPPAKRHKAVDDFAL
jgi:hypothetical protein